MIYYATDDSEETFNRLLCIQDLISGVILRMDSICQIALIKRLMNENFNSDLIIAYVDVELLKYDFIRRIHFRSMTKGASQLKQRYPKVVMSMSVHNEKEIKYALRAQMDLGIYSPLFKSASKPNAPHKTREEIINALSLGLPLIALGGINEHTIHCVPKGFVDLAGISLFQTDKLTIQSILNKRGGPYEINN